MDIPFLRSTFNFDRDAHSNESALTCLDDSLAIQSAESESNINTIVRKFGLTGQLPDQVAMPQSGEFHDIPDYHTAMNLIRKTNEEFLKVPAEVRARFGNDPQSFMMFVEDDANRDEARRLGLLKPVPPVPASGTPDAGTP
ncbi:scaffold protein [Microviridae sp.]|nr:scaffold protein [Microviridae sp.]